MCFFYWPHKYHYFCLHVRCRWKNSSTNLVMSGIKRLGEIGFGCVFKKRVLRSNFEKKKRGEKMKGREWSCERKKERKAETLLREKERESVKSEKKNQKKKHSRLHDNFVPRTRTILTSCVNNIFGHPRKELLHNFRISIIFCI